MRPILPESKFSIASLSVFNPCRIAASSESSCSNAHSSATLARDASVSKDFPAATLSSHL